MKSKFLIGLLFALWPLSVQAADCDSLVVDNAGIISDKSVVAKAASRVTDAGATVRVRTLKSLEGAPNLDSYVKTTLMAQCPSWVAPDHSHFMSSLLLLVYTPDHGATGTFFGNAIQPKLGNGKWMDIMRSQFVPGVKAYKQGETDGITNGFVRTLGEYQAVLLKSSSGGNVTITNTTPTDFSGLWHFLMWALFAGIFLIGLFVFLKWQSHRDRVRSAQFEAKRVRSDLIATLLDYQSPTTQAVLESATIVPDAKFKAQLKLLFDQFNQYVSAANNSLMMFDSVTGDDPNNASLTIEQYERNQTKYEDINSKYIIPATEVMKNLKAGIIPKKTATKTKNYKPINQPAGVVDPGTGKPYTDTPSPSASSYTDNSSTIVMVNNDSSGYRRREDDDYYRPTPPVPTPSRSSRNDDDDGGSFSSSSSSSDYSSSSDWGGSFSSDSSSSFDYSSSSDSGGSFSSDT